MSYVEMNFLNGGSGASSADKVSYDNTISGLESDNVQDAIDELNSNLEEVALKKYSTTPKRIGTWVDGVSGVYEQTFVVEGVAIQQYNRVTVVLGLATGLDVKAVLSYEGCFDFIYDNVHNYFPVGAYVLTNTQATASGLPTFLSSQVGHGSNGFYVSYQATAIAAWARNENKPTITVNVRFVA